MKMHKLVLLAVAFCWALGASAQWQWVDKDGRKVFSDRPPPEDVPQKSILKQPTVPTRAVPSANPDAAPVAAAAPAPGAAPAAPVPRPSGKDSELEAKKAASDAEQEARKKVEADRVAKARAENCTRAQQSKATLNSGQLLSRTNAQGERVFMDDAARAADIRRADAVIASDCGPAKPAS